MKIQITKDIAGHTSVKIDDVELNNFVSEFHLTQKVIGQPELFLKVPISPLDELEIDLPDGVVIVDKTAGQD